MNAGDTYSRKPGLDLKSFFLGAVLAIPVWVALLSLAAFTINCIHGCGEVAQ